MKIRNGFVSNSSSSSFVLFGLEDVSEPDTEKVLKWITKSTSLEEVEKKWKVWYSEKKATSTNPEWYSEETLVEWLESVLDDGFGELSYNLDLIYF